MLAGITLHNGGLAEVSVVEDFAQRMDPDSSIEQIKAFAAILLNEHTSSAALSRFIIFYFK